MNMIYIKSYYHETRTYTPEEYIKFRLLESPSHVKWTKRFARNVGVTKTELKNLAKSKYSITDIKSDATKEVILEKILYKEDIYVLADMYKIGVKWFQYAETFGLSLNQIIKLEGIGFLKIIDYDINDLLQKESVYDIKQFANMTREKINEAIEKNKFYREKNDICIESINNVFKSNKEFQKTMEDIDDKFKDVEEFADDPENFAKKFEERK